MSGDISDTLPLPDAAGIIPRVLHQLFDKLGEGEAERAEYSVKCSFIELYNEELRDLLAVDDNTKLKIFDEANKNGRTTTLVQGMEERHIKSASKGIQLLRDGSHKRQVAATKCNDLSSRSHTVFTITVYLKRTSDSGEDFVASGKLNLVDLAGSENIQRSGAENKRAVEAGLINKSLLTLGRVINALVDRGSHIPYRESKLTRLLQDSLGGRTKTCIIATLSPAKSNLEETISTLDYAFRAKNIRNKPQVNQMVSKKTLLKEFTAEIEKLKSELIATRSRNGVYLTTEAYEDMLVESESRRILNEEQKDTIEMKEALLRNKCQELFALTSNFLSLKKDVEQTRLALENTKDILEKTEIVLQHTRQSFAEETQLRKAHQETERKLREVGNDLLGSLETTTDHVDKLHSKLKRRSLLQTRNRTKWTESQSHVTDTTLGVEGRLDALRVRQDDLISALSSRMQSFVADELHELQSSQEFMKGKMSAFEESKSEVHNQTSQSRDEMDFVLQEIGTLRDDVKQKVGAGLSDLSGAAQRISAGIATELDIFHGQLQESFVSLGREFKTLFEDLIKRMNEQQLEAQKLRREIADANKRFVEAGELSHGHLQQAIDQERETSAKERESLMLQITSLINTSAAAHETRLSGYLDSANKRIKISASEYQVAQQAYGSGMDAWSSASQSLIDSSVQARESIKAKLKADWTTANEQTIKITETTNAVHGETVRIVDDQMEQMDNQLSALDDIVTRLRQQNEVHHNAHVMSLGKLASNVQESYGSISEHFETSYSRTKALEAEVQDRTDALAQTLPDLAEGGDIHNELRSLREDVAAASIEEYQVTGATPARMQYTYPTVLPRTEDHDVLLDRIRGIERPTTSPRKSPSKRSPSKPKNSPTKISTSSPTKSTAVFTDTPPTLSLPPPASAPILRAASSSSVPSLRERDVNVTAGSVFAGTTVSAGHTSAEAGTESGKMSAPPLKRQYTNPLSASVSQIDSGKLPTKRSTRMTVANLAAAEAREKENMSLSASVGPSLGGGRRLRNRGSD